MKIQRSVSMLIYLAAILFNGVSAKAQCTDTLPGSTIILTTDTTLGMGGFNNHYLICPGVQVIYSGTQSIMNHYYLESGAWLILNSYHYPYLYLKSTAEINAQHSINPASIIMSVYAETGAIFTDTLNPYTPDITWCNPLLYNYSNLPNAQGCPLNAVSQNNHPAQIKVYPNPFTLKTTVESQVNNMISIEITDLAGEIIYSKQANCKRLSIETNGFSRGVYIIRITDERKNVFHRKIIVQ